MAVIDRLEGLRASGTHEANEPLVAERGEQAAGHPSGAWHR